MNNIIYNVCKRVILRGKIPENMDARLKVFSENGLIAAEQYDELIQLMEVI